MFNSHTTLKILHVNLSSDGSYNISTTDLSYSQEVYILIHFFAILNNLNTNIQFTIEANSKYFKIGCNVQELPFLDVLVILRDHKHFSTDIFYKETNSNFYLDYNSHHPKHIKDNIPYGLAKKIIIFVSDDQRAPFRLQQMKSWLLKCNYPLKIINRGFHNAKLQGPAPGPRRT